MNEPLLPNFVPTEEEVREFEKKQLQAGKQPVENQQPEVESAGQSPL